MPTPTVPFQPGSQPPQPDPESLRDQAADALGEAMAAGMPPEALMLRAFEVGLRRSGLDPDLLPPELLEKLQGAMTGVFPQVEHMLVAAMKHAISPELLAEAKAAIRAASEPEPEYPLPVERFARPAYWGSAAGAEYRPWNERVAKHLKTLLTERGIQYPQPLRIPGFGFPESWDSFPSDPQLESVLLQLQEEELVQIGERIHNALFPVGTGTLIREGRLTDEITDEHLRLLVWTGYLSPAAPGAPPWLKAPVMGVREVKNAEGEVVERVPETLQDHGITNWPDPRVLVEERGVDARLVQAVCSPVRPSAEQLEAYRQAHAEAIAAGRREVEEKVLAQNEAKRDLMKAAAERLRVEAEHQRGLQEEARLIGAARDAATGALLWLARKIQGATPAEAVPSDSIPIEALAGNGNGYPEPGLGYSEPGLGADWIELAPGAPPAFGVGQLVASPEDLLNGESPNFRGF